MRFEIQIFLKTNFSRVDRLRGAPMCNSFIFSNAMYQLFFFTFLLSYKTPRERLVNAKQCLTLHSATRRYNTVVLHRVNHDF